MIEKKYSCGKSLKKAKISYLKSGNSALNDSENVDDVTKRKIAQKPQESISTVQSTSSKFDSPNPFGPLADSVDMETAGDELEDHAEPSKQV